MNDELTLFDGAVARADDPETSWAAARSIEVDALRRSQQAVYRILEEYGPQTDEQIYQRVHGSLSPSGARTRRAELVNQGLVQWTGDTRPLVSGRQARVWEITHDNS